MLVRRLVRKGYQVIEAADGLEAVTQWRAHAPQVILMDVSMPHRNGLEATRDIRAAAPHNGPAIIALTAHAMTSMRDECMDAGCNAFATKPVDFPALIALIEQMPKGLVTPPSA